MAWKKIDAEQLGFWEERHYKIAPIRSSLKELRKLLRLIEGNGPVVVAMDKILVDALVTLEQAVAADSEYWRWLRDQARGNQEGEDD